MKNKRLYICNLDYLHNIGKGCVAIFIIIVYFFVTAMGRPVNFNSDKSSNLQKRTIDVVKPPLCNKHYVGETIKFDAESQNLDDFIKFLNEKYAANIALDPELKELKVSMSNINSPWSTILKVILSQNGLGIKCVDKSIVRIAKKEKI